MHTAARAQAKAASFCCQQHHGDRVVVPEHADGRCAPLLPRGAVDARVADASGPEASTKSIASKLILVTLPPPPLCASTCCLNYGLCF